MLARQNSVFPEQPKIYARIRAARKDVGPAGFTRVKIPWSDFIFSNSQPWPQSFRQGLKNYCSFYKTWSIRRQEGQRPKWDRTEFIGKKFKWSPKTVEPETARQENALRKHLTQLPDLSLNDLYDIYVSEPAVYATEVYDADLSGELKSYRWSSFEFVKQLVNRAADCDGLFVDIMGPKHYLQVFPTHDPDSRGAMARSFGDYPVVMAKDDSPDVLMHECMHLAQRVGDELLLALSRPQHAFIWLIAPTQVGLPAAKSSCYDYYDSPSEFYPMAYSAALAEMKKTLSFQGPSSTDVLRIMNMPILRQRVKFLEAVLIYFKRAKGLPEHLTENDMGYIRSLASGDPVILGARLGEVFSRVNRDKPIVTTKPFNSQLYGAAKVRFNLFPSMGILLQRPHLIPDVSSYVKEVSHIAIRTFNRLTSRSVPEDYWDVKTENYFQKLEDVAQKSSSN